MRCNSCNKFVPFDEDVDVEIDSDGEVSDGTYRAEVSRVLNCAECSDELKRGTFSIEHDFASDLSEADAKCKGYEGDVPPEDFVEPLPDDVDAFTHEWTVESEDYENNDRRETVNAKGKPIKARYQTQYRGVTGNISLVCEKCGQSHEFSVSDEMAASAMEEMR